MKIYYPQSACDKNDNLLQLFMLIVLCFNNFHNSILMLCYYVTPTLHDYILNNIQWEGEKY